MTCVTVLLPTNYWQTVVLTWWHRILYAYSPVLLGGLGDSQCLVRFHSSVYPVFMEYSFPLTTVLQWALTTSALCCWSDIFLLVFLVFFPDLILLHLLKNPFRTVTALSAILMCSSFFLCGHHGHVITCTPRSRDHMHTTVT